MFTAYAETKVKIKILIKDFQQLSVTWRHLQLVTDSDGKNRANIGEADQSPLN